MTTETQYPEKTMVDLLRDIYRCRGMMFLGAVVGCLMAVFVTVFSTPYYKAKLVVSAANPMNGAEISSLLADDSLFALRYLVQRVGVENASDFLRFENIYDGAAVADILLQQPDVMRGIAHDKTWNFEEVRPLSWSAAQLSDYIQKNITLEPVNGTSLRQMVYHHPNPDFATYFLTGIHQVSDALIRKTVKEEAQERTQYLQQQSASTKNPEHRRALTTLLMEQERLLMLASLEQPYAAAIIEPASASYRAIWPNIPLLFFGLSVAGAVFGFLLGAIGLAWREKERGVPANAKEWFDPKTANVNAKKQKAEERLSRLAIQKIHDDSCLGYCRYEK